MIDENTARQMAVATTSGYWKVNDKCFFDKRECLLYATVIKNYNVSFHFFDDVYQSIDWSTEPEKTLEQLYCDRARQLREKYDYIIIQFSGGSDSMNILDTFLNNNIRIDEIVTYYPISVIDYLYSSFNKNDTSNKNLIFEYKTCVEPKLKKISQSNPEIKISVLDYTDRAIELTLDEKLQKCSNSLTFTPSLAGRNLLGHLMMVRGDQKKRVASISGIDKPRMGYNPKTGKIGTWFDDVSVPWDNYSGDPFDGFQPRIEYFYYTLDMIDLWKKQCITLKRLMEPIVNSDPRPEFYKQIHYRSFKNNEIFRVHHNFFKKTLYSGWDTSLFQAGKPKGYWYNESAQWFFDGVATNKRTKDYFHSQLLDFISEIDPKFVVWDKELNRPLRFIDLATKSIHVK
jgi:hypothetical protein